MPDTNIKVSHTIAISNVWPRSGCEINNNRIGKSIMLLKKYLKYKLFFFKHNNEDKITIKKGLIISIGWNLGKKPKSIHLCDPFTSIPMNGTKTKVMKAMPNKILDILNKISSFKNEKKISTAIPKIINVKCFIKK